MKFDAEVAAGLRQLLRWRRDVRHFRIDPIPEETVERLSAAMELAPSVGNSRPWRVLRVEDKRLRTGVREIFEACNADAALAYAGKRARHYRNLKLAGLETAPLQLAVFTDADPPRGHGLGRHTMHSTLEQSTAMAIHTLWLASRAENIGLGMVSILDPKKMERLFETPSRWRFSSYLCLGWPEFDDDTPLLHRVGWQENGAALWPKR
jgi:5,6-dimethylbenzimidazole synthase